MELMVFGLPGNMYTLNFLKVWNHSPKFQEPWLSHGDLVCRKKHPNFYTNENEPLAPENTHLEKNVQNLETIIFKG